jgi:hypothetical protein
MATLRGPLPWLRCWLFFSFFVLISCVSGHYLAAQTFSTIYTFDQPAAMFGPLVVDHEGNLFGSTAQGGKYNAGVIFKLAKPAAAGGSYKFTVLHHFDGAAGGSAGSGLTMDASGNLFGTTVNGGLSSAWCTGGCGVVYELARPATSAGPWNYSVLYSFQGYPNDGAWPRTLTVNSQGVLYGTTQLGGSSDVGTVFQLLSSSTGWSESVLFSVLYDQTPCNPPGPLTFDSSGNIYFPTPQGGPSNTGCAIQLTPPVPPAIGWKATLLHAYGDAAGTTPSSPLLVSGTGELFGVALTGGNAAQGTLYKLSPEGSSWTDRLLYSFSALSPADGYDPAGLVAGPTSSIYYGGATTGGYCGIPQIFCGGTVFQLHQPTTQGGAWTLQVLYTFQGGTDGAIPYDLIKDNQGTLYGVTYYGGFVDSGACQVLGCGTIFKITFP